MSEDGKHDSAGRLLSSEEAKAVQAGAKAISDVASLVGGLGSFLDKVFGPAAREAGGLLADWLRYKRENLEAIRRGVDAKLDKRGRQGELRHLPVKYGVPILEAAALEDDPLLRDMWAGLIANALDPAKRFIPRKVFTQVLREMEPLDASILNLLASANWGVLREVPGGGYTVARLCAELERDETEMKLSLLNMYRLGLLKDVRPETMDSLNESSSGLRVDEKNAVFQPTYLGYKLHEACSTDG
jgi:hypothetical protein